MLLDAAKILPKSSTR